MKWMVLFKPLNIPSMHERCQSGPGCPNFRISCPRNVWRVRTSRWGDKPMIFRKACRQTLTPSMYHWVRFWSGTESDPSSDPESVPDPESEPELDFLSHAKYQQNSKYTKPSNTKHVLHKQAAGWKQNQRFAVLWNCCSAHSKASCADFANDQNNCTEAKTTLKLKCLPHFLSQLHGFFKACAIRFFDIADFAFTDWSLVLDSIASSRKALIWLRSKLATGFWVNSLDDDSLSDSLSESFVPVPSLVADDSSRGRLRGGGSDDVPSLEDGNSNRCMLAICDDMPSWNIEILATKIELVLSHESHFSSGALGVCSIPLNILINRCFSSLFILFDTWKVDGATPKRSFVSLRGHQKPINGSCAIYFPGLFICTVNWLLYLLNIPKPWQQQKTSCRKTNTQHIESHGNSKLEIKRQLTFHTLKIKWNSSRTFHLPFFYSPSGGILPCFGFHTFQESCRFHSSQASAPAGTHWADMHPLKIDWIALTLNLK